MVTRREPPVTGTTQTVPDWSTSTHCWIFVIAEFIRHAYNRLKHKKQFNHVIGFAFGRWGWRTCITLLVTMSQEVRHIDQTNNENPMYNFSLISTTPAHPWVNTLIHIKQWLKRHMAEMQWQPCAWRTQHGAQTDTVLWILATTSKGTNMIRYFPKLRSSRSPIKLKTGYVDGQPHVSGSEFFSNTSTRIVSLF